MDEHLQKLKREYAATGDPEIAIKIANAVIRSEGAPEIQKSTEQKSGYDPIIKLSVMEMLAKTLTVKDFCNICLNYGEVYRAGTKNIVDCPNHCWYPNKYPDY